MGTPISSITSTLRRMPWRDALQRRACDIGAGMPEGEAEDDAPGIRVVDGRSLAAQVGQQVEAVGARG